MKHGLQKQIAKKVGISRGYLSELIAVKKRPSWHTAKKLSLATNTDPVLWLEGDSEDIKKSLSKNADQAEIKLSLTDDMLEKRNAERRSDERRNDERRSGERRSGERRRN